MTQWMQMNTNINTAESRPAYCASLNTFLRLCAARSVFTM